MTVAAPGGHLEEEGEQLFFRLCFLEEEVVVCFRLKLVAPAGQRTGAGRL